MCCAGWTISGCSRAPRSDGSAWPRSTSAVRYELRTADCRHLALTDPCFASGSWPSGRWGHSATAVPAGLNQSVTRSLVVFGGRGEGSTMLNDVWSFSFVTMSWSALSPSGAAPSGRYLHSAVLLGELVYIFVRPQTGADLCWPCL